MGERIEDGGPAFPGDMPTVQLDGNKLPFASGMSLRDWFAGQALSGLLQVCVNDTLDGRPYFNHVAKHAYAMADEMLARRTEASPHV